MTATVKTCALNLRAHEIEAAFQDYADFVDRGGAKIPAATWLELCKGAEEKQDFERALSEYQQLAAAYPAERQALTAQLSAARLLPEAAKPSARCPRPLPGCGTASPDPASGLGTQHIQSGIKEAKNAMAGGNAVAAGAQ